MVGLHGEVRHGLAEVVERVADRRAVGGRGLGDRDDEHGRVAGPGLVEAHERVDDLGVQGGAAAGDDEAPRLDVVGGGAPAGGLERGGELGLVDRMLRVVRAGLQRPARTSRTGCSVGAVRSMTGVLTEVPFGRRGSDTVVRVHGDEPMHVHAYSRRSVRVSPGGCGRRRRRARRGRRGSRGVRGHPPRGGEDLPARFLRERGEVDRRGVARPHELGEEPHREPGVDEPDVRGEVGELETHVRLEPGGAAELLGPRAGRRAGRLEHPRLRAGGPQGGDGVGSSRSSGAPGEGDGVVGEHDTVEVGVDGACAPRILLGEDEVVVAAGDAHEAGFRVALGHLDAQGGVALAEGREGAGQQGVRGGLEHREAHGAGHLGERLGDGDLGVLELIEDADGLGDQHVPLRRELHPATDPTQQWHSDIALQRGELLGHGGLAVGQRVGHRGERAAARQFHEQTQAVGVQHDGSQSFGMSEQNPLESVDRRSLPSGWTMIQPHTTPGVRGRGRYPAP